MDARAIDTLCISAVTVAELRFSLAAKQKGKRRTIYQDRLERQVLPAFRGRLPPFDLDASQAYADLMARARAAGRAISKDDGYIAATASVHGLAVATRDTGPFIAAGLRVLDPWAAAQ